MSFSDQPSLSNRVALGPRAGARVRRGGDPPEDVAPIALGPCHAHVDGFGLYAGLVTRSGQRDRLERLCRYVLRPPLAGVMLTLRRLSGFLSSVPIHRRAGFPVSCSRD